MDKTALGSRWVCFECHTSFFDLNKEKAVCPKCGTDQDNNPNRVMLSKQQKQKEPEKEPDDMDDEIDFDDDGEDMGIESFEQLEEAADADDGEDDYA